MQRTEPTVSNLRRKREIQRFNGSWIVGRTKEIDCRLNFQKTLPKSHPRTGSSKELCFSCNQESTSFRTPGEWKLSLSQEAIIATSSRPGYTCHSLCPQDRCKEACPSKPTKLVPGISADRVTGKQKAADMTDRAKCGLLLVSTF